MSFKAKGLRHLSLDALMEAVSNDSACSIPVSKVMVGACARALAIKVVRK